MARLEELTPHTSIRGILSNGLVTVVSVQWHGSLALELTYKTPEGKVANELLYLRSHRARSRGHALDRAKQIKSGYRQYPELRSAHREQASGADLRQARCGERPRRRYAHSSEPIAFGLHGDTPIGVTFSTPIS